MVDYSRAATSRAAKDSFDKAARSLIAEIQQLQAEYNEEWRKVEELRKSRASLIENIIPILKSNNVKLSHPLSRCDNKQVMTQLADTVNSLDVTPQEEIRVAMVRIETRYGQLVRQAKKLDALYERLSKYYVPEKDYDDEVVISLKGRKKDKVSEAAREEVTEEVRFEEPSLEPSLTEEIELDEILDEVIDQAPVPQELADDDDALELEISEEPAFADNQYYDRFFVGEQVELDAPIGLDLDDNSLDFSSDEVSNRADKPDRLDDDGDIELETEHDPLFDTIQLFGSDDFNAISSYLDETIGNENGIEIQELGNASSDTFYEGETNEGELVISSTPASKELIASLKDLINSKKVINLTVTKNDVELEPKYEEEPDYCSYSLKEDQTLAQIVDYVYEGSLSWYDLYLYADNEEVISARCEELGMDIADAANTPGVFANIELKYPKAITPVQQKGRAKAA